MMKCTLKRVCYLLFLPLLFSFLCLSTVSFASDTDYHPRRMLIRSDSLGTAEEIATAHHMRISKTFETLSAERGFWYGVLELKENTRTKISDIIEKVNGKRGVIAEYDSKYTIQVTPNDLSFHQMHQLHNTGQTGGKKDADIDAPEAWDIEIGSKDVIIAVIDTGVDYLHQDLHSNMWKNPDEIPGNGVDDDHNGYVDDIYGVNAIDDNGNPLDDNDHGSHCSGIIGASGNNGEGITGINWQVSMMGAKFLDASGSGWTSDAIECYDYIIDQKKRGRNIVAINNSWGGGPYNQTVSDAVESAGKLDIISVFASGNSNRNIDTAPDYPASLPSEYILSVGSTDHNDKRSFFSNYGLTNVDLAAPGSDIFSCSSRKYYMLASGTSMAAPHVTGAIGLAAARFPKETIHQRISRIMQSVDLVWDWAGKSVTGGRLNIRKVVDGEYIHAIFTAATDPFTLKTTFTDHSSASNTAITTWSWNFGDGAVSVLQHPTHTYSKRGTYTVSLKITDGGTLSKTIERDIAVPLPSPYPYCFSKGLDMGKEWIAQVDIGSFSNPSGQEGHGNFTNQIIDIQKGVAIPVRITPGFSGKAYKEYASIWVDLNGDKDFADEGETVFEGALENDLISGSFTVPTSAVSGKTRMRITMNYYLYPKSCGPHLFAEVEDYTLNLQ